MQAAPRFSYIHSNITPSHSSCPTSFSVCNFPPEYRYVFLLRFLYCPFIFQVPHIKLVMHKHPPRPKGAGPRQNPVVLMSNCIRLAVVMERWYHGPNRVPTRRCVVVGHILYDMLIISGQLVHVVLVAAVCNKPATHKLRGFASHSHTLFCTLCWISSHDKEKPMAFQEGGTSLLFALLCVSQSHSPQHFALGQMKSILSPAKHDDSSQELCKEPCILLYATVPPSVL
jgi:hypothetical protein